MDARPNPVPQARWVTIVLRITNADPEVVRDASVTLTLPPNLVYASGPTFCHGDQQRRTCWFEVVCPVTAFGDPGVVYRIGFTIGDTRYDLRFTRVMASFHPPEANIGDPIRPSTSGFFRMYYTRPTIPPMAVELIPIDGGLGVVGRAITFRVPLVDVEAKPGDELRQVQAYTWIAQDSAAAPVVLLDEIAGPDSVRLSPASVGVGLAPKGQEAPASFSKASLHHGLFDAAFPAFEDGSGLDAWIRTCIGEECVVTRQRL